tara:strand:- start:51 stop:710 length:660 start_codon:yes stop_codon:yes gene_type:complete
MAFKMKGNPMQRNFGIGSPLHKGETSTWDKIKSAASAVTSNLGKVNSVSDSLSDKISRSYKKNKKQYREEQAKEASGAKMKSPAKDKQPNVKGHNTPGESELSHVTDKHDDRERFGPSPQPKGLKKLKKDSPGKMYGKKSPAKQRPPAPRPTPRPRKIPKYKGFVYDHPGVTEIDPKLKELRPNKPSKAKTKAKTKSPAKCPLLALAGPIMGMLGKKKE